LYEFQVLIQATQANRPVFKPAEAFVGDEAKGDENNAREKGQGLKGGKQ